MDLHIGDSPFVVAEHDDGRNYRPHRSRGFREQKGASLGEELGAGCGSRQLCDAQYGVGLGGATEDQLAIPYPENPALGGTLESSHVAVVISAAQGSDTNAEALN